MGQKASCNFKTEKNVVNQNAKYETKMEKFFFYFEIRIFCEN